MRLQINHTTRYDYDAPVDYALQKVRLRPVSSGVQAVEAWELDIEGGALEASYTDHFGNRVDLVRAEAGADSLTIAARGTVETQDTSGVFGPVYGAAPLWLFQQTTALTEPGPKVEALASVMAAHETTLAGLHALSAEVLKVVPYEFGHTTSETCAEDAIKIGRGVCQDHAGIFIAAARTAGLPARYVSGYLLLNDQVEQDASHAWAEVHVEDLGWVGFDVSNGVSPDEKYVRVAIGRDARDAAPISGLRVGSGDEKMMVTLQVQQ